MELRVGALGLGNAKNMNSIDLNADLGEGSQFDAQFLQSVSSANIACGGHTGDRNSILQALGLAQAAGVQVGAHPSFLDHAHFGRRAMPFDAPKILADLRLQLNLFFDCAAQVGIPVRHIKPHGALYNQAAFDLDFAELIFTSIAEFDKDLMCVVLAGSPMVEWARARNITVIEEAFADRRYQCDGRLVSRQMENACIEDEGSVLQQCLDVIQKAEITSVEGSRLRVHADTLCVHGDGVNALQLLRYLRQHFELNGIRVDAFQKLA